MQKNSLINLIYVEKKQHFIVWVLPRAANILSYHYISLGFKDQMREGEYFPFKN